MSIRKKTIIFILLGTVFAVVILWILTQIVLLGNFKKLEKDRAHLNAEQVQNSFLGKIDELNTSVIDWANWDDTYKFMEDKNDDYIASNLTTASSGDIGWDMLFFVDNDNELFHYKVYGEIENEEPKFVSEFISSLETDNKLLSKENIDASISGVVKYGNKFAIVASRNVLTSSGEGPTRGNIIALRLINSDEITDLEERTKTSLDIVDNLNLPMSELIDTRDNYSLYLINDDSLAGVLSFKDLELENTFYIVAEMHRDIYLEGLKTSMYFIAFIVILGLILVISGVGFIEMVALRRIKKLASETQKIASFENIDFRFSDTGSDEISLLSKNINKMLDGLAVLKKKAEGDALNIADKLNEIEQKNKTLEQTKMAMLNLLEDSQQLEKDLSLERDRMHGVVASMGEGLLVVDQNSKIALINPMAENLLQVNGADCIGRNWSEIVSTIKGGAEKSVPVHERSFSLVLEGKKTIVTRIEDDHYYKTLKGNVFPVESVTAPLPGGGAVKVFRDVSHDKEERKRIEEIVELRTKELREASDKVAEGWLNLQEEKARLVSSIESLPRGFALTDINGEILLTNNFLEELIGKKDSVPLTINSLTTIFSSILDLKSEVKKCIKQDSKFTKTNIDFNDKIIEFYIKPIVAEDTQLEKSGDQYLRRKIIGSIILIGDITESKLLERSKDEFFSIASHELRTPLTAIRGNASLIQQYYGDQLVDNDLKEMIVDIHASSIRLIEIVNDFLDLSRLQQGRIKYNLAKVAINDVVDTIINEVKVNAEAKGVTLVRTTKDDKILANVDVDRIKQVVMNLIGNALKFTEKGGVTIDVSKDLSKVFIRIIDSGSGIPPANQALLFRKFQQAGSSIYTRDTTRGTGLGLYISKLLVEGMGGKVYLEKSEVGKGSTFTIEVPVAE